MVEKVNGDPVKAWPVRLPVSLQWEPHMEQEIGSEEQTEARRREKEQGHKARSAMRSQKADSPEGDDSGDETGSQIGHWVSSPRQPFQDAEHATFLPAVFL